MHKKGIVWLVLLLLVIVAGLSSLTDVCFGKHKPSNSNVEIATEEKIPVKLGIDNIDKHLDVFEGKRVGLITNATGINSEFKSSVDVLYEKTNLVALFSPEHGIRGAVGAGAGIGSSTDSKTGLPVYSLYGQTKKPTPEMLADIDILAFDIQDVGARAYTYIYTMAYAMQSCKEQGKTMVIFDRPNPIGGIAVEGGIVKPGFESFISVYPIPIRHGMTVGELAKLFNAEFGINCNLIVIEMTGWKRDMYYADTNLPWIMTSPNIPTPDTTMMYPGTGIFGGTNVSEGVGTTRPFELVGAPWIDAELLAEKMTSLKLPGVVFRPTYFTPRFGLYQGEMCAGVQLHITNPKVYEPVRTGVSLLYTIKDNYNDKFSFKRNEKNEGTIDLATGDDAIRSGRYNLGELLALWDNEAREFKEKSKKYYLYQ